MYSPYGGGAVVGLTDVLNAHMPEFYGGGTIKIVGDTWETYKEAPARYEAGSPNYPGVIGMGKPIDVLTEVGFRDIQAYLSTKPEKAVGDPERWEQATQSLREALESEGLSYEVDEGGGAFYGPKIDMKIKDALGRPWQLGTVQFDFNLPERFDLTYIGSDGKEHRPYMVHRALLGSIERFFGILIEHYAGAFPLWLAPEQVRILPISDKVAGYARRVQTALREAGFRVDVDLSPDKLGAKIRSATLQKVPYQIVVGPRDEAAGTLSVRSRADGDLGALSLEDVIARLKAALAE
jgi:threonyl-tRNA synthetase